MLGFIVVSGLPASGKSSLASALGAKLGWQVLDKDKFLVDLFCSRGVGDDAWRTVLSREADALFRRAVESSRTTVACSWWRHPKSAEASGTPIDWLATLPAPIVEIHCECSPAVAKARFFNRTRHPGHLDSHRSESSLLASLEERQYDGPLFGHAAIVVNTERSVNLEGVASRVRARLLAAAPGGAFRETSFK